MPLQNAYGSEGTSIFYVDVDKYTPDKLTVTFRCVQHI